MKLNIFNEEKIDSQILEYIPKLETQFVGLDINDVNVIFVEEEDIKNLNSEFRDIGSVTDVLSFNIDSKELLGEIYICPSYVKQEREGIDFKEEILRLVIHGILHLTGYDHEVELNEETKSKIEMFVKQEKILENVIS